MAIKTCKSVIETYTTYVQTYRCILRLAYKKCKAGVAAVRMSDQVDGRIVELCEKPNGNVARLGSDCKDYMIRNCKYSNSILWCGWKGAHIKQLQCVAQA